MTAKSFSTPELGATPPAAEASASAGVPGEVVVDVSEATFEEMIERSRQVPILVDLWAPWCGPCRQLGPVLEKVVREQGGRMQLAKINVDENPAISQVFQVQGIPAVFAIVGGRPMPAFTGAIPEGQVRQVVAKILEVAASQGVTGTLAGGEGGEPAAPAENPELAAARDALVAKDYQKALEEIEVFLKKNPGDDDGEKLEKRCQLAIRLDKLGNREAAVAAAASAAPNDLEKHLAAADVEFEAGDAPVAFGRLLATVAATQGEARDQARERLVDFFTMQGQNDPLVTETRKKLTMLLY